MAEGSPDQGRYQDIRTVTLVGAVVNIVLAMVKIVVGFIGHSHALITDGVHSLSDLASDALVVYAAKQGSREADETHPYGHARIETAFTVALGLLLILIAVGIIVDAGRRLLEPALLLHPEPLTLVVVLIAILSKEGLYHYTLRVATRIRSNLLRANAWHHRSDAISSIVVLIGIAGALLGGDYLDAFASVGVALMIIKIGWDLGWEAIQELVDTALEPERVAKIRQSILQVEGVKSLHMLRTRRMGSEALVDVHVQVNPRLSVSEGHQIGEYVRTRVVEEIAEVADVTVHIDPEDDTSHGLTQRLPLRRDILDQLQPRWRSMIDLAVIQGINLHYLGGKVHIELILPLSLVEDMAQARVLTQRLEQTGEGIDEIGPIQVYFVCCTNMIQ